MSAATLNTWVKKLAERAKHNVSMSPHHSSVEFYSLPPNPPPPHIPDDTCPFLNDIAFYKITKIVRALCLAERSVWTRVCKHGCGVKLFGFSRANYASTNLKTFSSSKLEKCTLFTHSFVGWNGENRYKEGESIFLRLSWHFKREKSVFYKASFCKIRTDYACKTSWTRFCDW